MTDSELFEQFDHFCKERGWTYVRAAKMIGVTKGTINNWKNGGAISLSARSAILTLLAEPESLWNGDCFLTACPAQAPVDRFLQLILEGWNRLSAEERGEIATRVAVLLEHKPKES